MQLLADMLLGIFIVWLGYRAILCFSWWVEQRSERILNETKKRSQKNG